MESLVDGFSGGGSLSPPFHLNPPAISGIMCLVQLHIHHHHPDLRTVLQAINALRQELRTAMSELSDKIAALQASVNAETDVITSAEALLAGLKTSLDDALAKLAAAGVQPADLQALTDLSASIDAKKTELAAAVAANTPAAPPTP